MVYGGYVKEYNEVSDISKMFLSDYFKGINSFDYIEEINKLEGKLKDLKPIRETIRYEEILKEATDKINEAEDKKQPSASAVPERRSADSGDFEIYRRSMRWM